MPRIFFKSFFFFLTFSLCHAGELSPKGGLWMPRGTVRAARGRISSCSRPACRRPTNTCPSRDSICLQRLRLDRDADEAATLARHQERVGWHVFDIQLSLGKVAGRRQRPRLVQFPSTHRALLVVLAERSGSRLVDGRWLERCGESATVSWWSRSSKHCLGWQSLPTSPAPPTASSGPVAWTA